MWGGLLLGCLQAETFGYFCVSLKFTALLYTKKNEYLSELLRFAFKFNAKLPEFYNELVYVQIWMRKRAKSTRLRELKPPVSRQSPGSL
jgi:hypothetical protein